MTQEKKPKEPDTKSQVVDISKALDDGTWTPPPVDDEYRERRLTEFDPLG